jgi:hypothetical protein
MSRQWDVIDAIGFACVAFLATVGAALAVYGIGAWLGCWSA